MKKFFCLAFAAMLCCGFVACGNDDEENVNLTSEEKLLVGTWTFEKGYENGYGYWYAEEDGYEEIVTYKSNGTGVVRVREYDEDYGWDGPETINFEWELVGSKLYAVFYGEESVSRVEKLTERELVLSDEEGRYYYVR
ncbi:MAG: lipocalin family protein [Alistipes sp.]|nr:lipocalin family protein [Alistipes sp.]